MCLSQVLARGVSACLMVVGIPDARDSILKDKRQAYQKVGIGRGMYQSWACIPEGGGRYTRGQVYRRVGVGI